MTNQELQEHNKVNLRLFCRGPRTIHYDRLMALNAKRIELVTKGDEEGLSHLVLQLNEILRANLLPDDADATLGDWNLALVKLMDVRIHCGRDISDPIGAPPYDQQSRSYVCPDCETEHKFTPALSDEEAAKREQTQNDAIDALV